jgi:hypothetical protein
VLRFRDRLVRRFHQLGARLCGLLSSAPSRTTIDIARSLSNTSMLRAMRFRTCRLRRERSARAVRLRRD